MDLHLLGLVDSFSEIKNYPLQIQNIDILLIHEENGFHLIQNKCGHFEIKMTQGWIEESAFACPLHGISFSLEDGSVCNRPFENCDPIIIFDLIQKDNSFYSSLQPRNKK